MNKQLNRKHGVMVAVSCEIPLKLKAKLEKHSKKNKVTQRATIAEAIKSHLKPAKKETKQ